MNTVYSMVSLFWTLCLAGCVFGLTKHWSKWIRTDDSYFTFEHVISVSIKDCFEACVLTKACQYVNYDVRAKLCYLIRTNQIVDAGISPGLTLPVNAEVQAGFVLGVKAELLQDGSTVCESCPDKGSCDVHASCRSSGCERPLTFKNSFYRSNNFTYNSKLRYFCNENYMTLTSAESTVTSSICKQDGTWSDVTFKCIPDTAVCRDVTCYYVYEEKTSWSDAIEKCAKTDGHLIDINDATEQQFIESFWWPSSSGGPGYRLWTGGNDLNIAGTFRWFDGSLFTYTNWNINQPNLIGTQQCNALERDLTWNNLECHELYSALCETSIL